ncbi:MAG: phosphocholine cytidylyltransferase family protein [Pirellulales bacterium]|nr:phosphocholine cytidylyltransferase family protein [Pirellulales bacterium]
MANSHTSAIILAAGLGNRLRPFTDDRPKCLVNFLGKPIIIRMIEQLSSVCVEEVTIVCGYCSDVLRKELGSKTCGIRVKYIENEKYAESNSMYSLWMAREQLARGGFVIEGDAVCGPRLIPGLAQRGVNQAFWAGQGYRGELDGCVLTRRVEDNRITKQEIVKNPVPGKKQNQYKSTGILSLSSDYGTSFTKWLDDDVAIGNINIYYDLVIAKHLEEKPIYIHDIGAEPWFEIDTIDDLAIAESRFH